MKNPATEPRLAADHHDGLLAVALGALSAAQWFEELAARPSAPGAPPLSADDPIVFAALGAVSLSRSLRRWLEEASTNVTSSSDPSAGGSAPTPGDLLR